MARRTSTARKPATEPISNESVPVAPEQENVVAEAETEPQAPPQPAPEQPNNDEGPAQGVTDSTVRIRYDGRADHFRIKGYAFKPGSVVDISEADVEELLTFPFERFTLVKE